MQSEGCVTLLYTEGDSEIGKALRTHLQGHAPNITVMTDHHAGLLCRAVPCMQLPSVSELAPLRPLGSELVVTVLTLIKCMPDAESFGCNTTREPCLKDWAESGHVEMGTGLVLLNEDYKMESMP